MTTLHGDDCMNLSCDAVAVLMVITCAGPEEAKSYWSGHSINNDTKCN